MKIRMMLLAAIVLLAACEEKAKDEKPETAEAAEKMGVPSEKEIKKEIDDNVKDVIDDKGPKWKVTYEGALEGEVEGGILVVVKVGPNTTFRGAGMTGDKRAKAKAGFSGRVSHYDKEKPPTAIVEMTLGDGTKCSDVSKADPTPSEIEVINPESKKYHAKLKGKMMCGEKKDKAVTYEAVLQK